MKKIQSGANLSRLIINIGESREAKTRLMASSRLGECPMKPCFPAKTVLKTERCSAKNKVSTPNCLEECCLGLIPKLATWQDRKFGGVGFYLAQALSGNGCFDTYPEGL